MESNSFLIFSLKININRILKLYKITVTTTTISKNHIPRSTISTSSYKVDYKQCRLKRLVILRNNQESVKFHICTSKPIALAYANLCIIAWTSAICAHAWLSTFLKSASIILPSESLNQRVIIQSGSKKKKRKERLKSK